MKILAYIMYLICLVVVGVMLCVVNVGMNTWQFWVLLITYPVAYVCGIVIGGR